MKIWLEIVGVFSFSPRCRLGHLVVYHFSRVLDKPLKKLEKLIKLKI